MLIPIWKPIPLCGNRYFLNDLKTKFSYANYRHMKRFIFRKDLYGFDGIAGDVVEQSVLGFDADINEGN